MKSQFILRWLFDIGVSLLFNVFKISQRIPQVCFMFTYISVVAQVTKEIFARITCWELFCALINFCFATKSRHSTDREVALMILMAYLSYMLAEVRFLSIIEYLSKDLVCFCFLLLDWISVVKGRLTIIFWISGFLAAILSKRHSHCILLWDCYVSLHMAQCNWKFKDNN
jgi:hypothetical protein